MGVTTPFPSPDAIARAERLTREHFVHEGETLEDALAPGSARRRALDAALTELDAGLKQPSIEWRRQFSLLLGLERLLSEEEPHLADGTVLSAHQVDALKEIVYEMRFDEVSARYGEFGPFFVNMRMAPAELWAHLGL